MKHRHHRGFIVRQSPGVPVVAFAYGDTATGQVNIGRYCHGHCSVSQGGPSSLRLRVIVKQLIMRHYPHQGGNYDVSPPPLDVLGTLWIPVRCFTKAEEAAENARAYAHKVAEVRDGWWCQGRCLDENPVSKCLAFSNCHKWDHTY